MTRALEDLSGNDGAFGPLDGASDYVLDAVHGAFFAALGPAGLNWVYDVNGDGSITRDDIAVTSSADEVQFDFRLRATQSLLDVPIGFDVGLPALGLELDGSVRVELGFDFAFGIGINKTQGVYLDTGLSAETFVDGNGRFDSGEAFNDLNGNQQYDDAELIVAIAATLPDFAASGRIRFLQVDATDGALHDVDGDGTVGENERAYTGVVGAFAVNVVEPAGDGRLTATELLAGQGDVEATFNGTADVMLHLVASFGDDANFPSLEADFKLHWAFAEADTAGGTADFGGVPEISFERVRLDLGDFIGGTIGPVLSAIQDVVEPVKPLLDVLDTRLPVISHLTGGDVTLLDLAERLRVSYVTFIRVGAATTRSTATERGTCFPIASRSARGEAPPARTTMPTSPA